MRELRKRLQIVFQDPIASLNPRMRVADIIAAPLKVTGHKDKAANYEKVRETLEAVGLDPAVAMEKRPHEFSGGQCQRISIARALILAPDLLVCDEPVSALDVSIQAQILNLLEDMKDRSTADDAVYLTRSCGCKKHRRSRCCDVPRQDLADRAVRSVIWLASTPVHEGHC